MRDPHPVLDINTCTLHAGTTPNPANQMVVFNPHWGTTRRIQIVAPSDPLQGLECTDKPEGKAFSVVHGYDRDFDVRGLFDFRYRYYGEFDLSAFKKYNEELALQQPAVSRGLRRPQRDVTVSPSKPQPAGRFFSRH